jgi:hypothetical protein
MRVGITEEKDDAQIPRTQDPPNGAVLPISASPGEKDEVLLASGA